MVIAVDILSNPRLIRWASPFNHLLRPVDVGDHDTFHTRFGAVKTTMQVHDLYKGR